MMQYNNEYEITLISPKLKHKNFDMITCISCLILNNLSFSLGTRAAELPEKLSLMEP